MTENRHDEGRRRFLRATVLSAAAVPLASGLMPHGLQAKEKLPKLSLDDPAAKALSYVEDASKTDNAAHQEGAHCANCQLYQGDPEAEYGPCSAFPGKRVHSQGWCSAWVKKA